MEGIERRRRVGRPPDPAKVEAIVAAAWSLFLEHGVEAVSLEAIAARAGVAKVTLYRHFGDKDALFEAGVLQEMRSIETAQRGAHSDEAGDLASALRAFGIGIMSFLASPPAVNFYGALSGDLRRHPGLARRFYDAGPGRTRANLAALLAEGAARGEIKLREGMDGANEAADHLFGLWQGLSNYRLLLGVEDEKLREELPRRIERAVAVFLRAYAPPVPADRIEGGGSDDEPEDH